ncbi:MAG: RnfABCDGE type electron transport complex subunit D [Chloroflexota bacterium]
MIQKTNITPGELAVSPGPHAQNWLSANRMMYVILFALILPTAAAIYFFGYHAISVIAVSTVTALITEYLAKRMRGRAFVMDGSAIVAGLLLALLMPPTIPLWMVAVGAFIAIAIAKEAFGGLGHYIFNPVLGGVAFMHACFPAEMATWVAPTGFGSEITSAAAPLSETFAANTSKLSMLIGDTSGGLGETSALLILIGGIILIFLRVIDWRIPLSLITTTFLFSALLGADPVFHLLTGSLMLGAFFLATDSTTTPLARRGKVVFGIGAGILLVLMRLYGVTLVEELFGDVVVISLIKEVTTEGVIYSILLMNAITPLIDRFLKAKPYGFKKAVKGEG